MPSSYTGIVGGDGGAWALGTGWLAAAPWGTVVLVVLAVFGAGVLVWMVLRVGSVLWQRWTTQRRRR
jgi:hypothetical protein